MDKFKAFLLTESSDYLGRRAGDLLSAIQGLTDDSQQLGNRALMRGAEGVVNQIRRILHSRWEEEDQKYLEKLQDVGVALAKAIDEREDLAELLASAGQEIEAMLGKLKVPLNRIAAGDGGEDAGDPAAEGGDDIPAEL